MSKPKATFDFDSVGMPEGVEADEWKLEYRRHQGGELIYGGDSKWVRGDGHTIWAVLVATPIVHAKKKMAWATVTRDDAGAVYAWFDRPVKCGGNWIRRQYQSNLSSNLPLPEPGKFLRRRFEVDDVAEGPES